MISNTFRGLDKTYQDLMMLTPQQLADVSRRSQAGDPNAPPSFLIVAALDAQNKAQQRQMRPPTQTVAEDVIAQAAQNQYQNRLAESGVAALPTARPMTYEGGGLVSFADGGGVPESAIQAIHNKYPFMSEEDIRKKLESSFTWDHSQDVREMLDSTSPGYIPVKIPYAPGYTPPPNVEDQISVSPEPEPTIADYIKMFAGTGAPNPDTGQPNLEELKRQYLSELEKVEPLGGPETTEKQLAADRDAMRAAGIDPEAELQRQIDLTNKRRKETEEYKEKGKWDILLQLGAAMMAGKSPHALVNIGEALKGTGTAIQEYRSAIDKRNELADEAEELARQAAYKQKVGDYESAKKAVVDRDLKNKEIDIHNATSVNKASINALQDRNANLRANLADARADTRNAQDLAIQLMIADRQTKDVQSKLEQEYNLAVLKNLDVDNISDKDLATVYKNTAESNGVAEYINNWKATHVKATPEQISKERDRFIQDRINDYMRLRNEMMHNQSALNSRLFGLGITSLSPR